jgi:hypothetical protein
MQAALTEVSRLSAAVATAQEAAVVSVSLRAECIEAGEFLRTKTRRTLDLLLLLLLLLFLLGGH